MAKSTSNIDLVKPGVDEFYDVNIMNSNLDKIDSYTGEIKNKIYNGSIQNTNLQLGCNRIQIPEISVSPKIEFTGFSYVNLLGRDGNCEDLSKWQGWQSTPYIDTANKAFGNSGIKITIAPGQNQGALVNLLSTYNINLTKYYFISAYLKNGNATSIALVKDTTSGGIVKQSVAINNTSNFTRVGIKIQPTDMALSNFIGAYVFGSTGQYGYVDGIMLNEISASDYALNETDLMDKYPYVDSYGCLTNPYFENRRYNLVRNGNCEEGIAGWTQFASGVVIAIENGKFRVTNTDTVTGIGTKVKLKPNTNYYLSGNITTGTSSGQIFVLTSNYSTQLRTGVGSFNSGKNTDAIVYFNNTSTSGYCYYDSIMLVEGTTALSEYKSCDLERFVVEGQFTSDDKVTIENGHVSGLLNWKHRTLFGKDYDWQFGADFTRFKLVRILDYMSVFRASSISGTSSLIKHDGKVLTEQSTATGGTYTSGDQYSLNTTMSTSLIVAIADSESGWIESANPNGNEVKAFMNGWKCFWHDGTRVVMWRSIVDDSLPAGAITTTAPTAQSTGVTTMTVADASNFNNGDFIIFLAYNGSTYNRVSISSKSGNTLTLSSGVTWQANTVVIKSDSATNTSLLNYCMTNIAPGYEGYRLHYKLANPEPITDPNFHVEGEIWDLVKGDNYVNIDSGIVLREVANPVNGGNDYYYINYFGSVPDSTLKYKNESILNVYKNNINDNLWSSDSLYPYGNKRAFIPATSFDTNATYTVDYQILKTLQAQTFGSLSLSYPQSIISTLEGHSKALEQKQSRNSVLDTLIDLSVYEEVRLMYLTGRAYVCRKDKSIVVITQYVRPYPKVCVPIVTAKLSLSGVGAVRYFDSMGVSIDIPLSDIKVSVGSPSVNKPVPIHLEYSGVDITIKNNLLNYGGYCYCDIVFDCRGRI
jgi:hypothetical protein